MEKNIFTEEEAINITIENGYDGSEFKTALWKTRGCLSPNRTLDALVSKLETVFHNVQVVGKGKKRKYILKDKKEEITEREYNYKGTVPTDEEETMKEYIFNSLVKHGLGNAKPYNGCIRDFSLFQQKSFSTKELIEEIKELHLGLLCNPKEIVMEFINAINNYNKSIVENSFRRLEKEGRISKSVSYYFKNVDGNYEKVEDKRYEEATNYKKKIVESYDIKYSQYIQAYFSKGHRSTKMQYIINEVDVHMANKFGIEYMYQAIGIFINDGNIKREISKEEFDQVYFQRFIQLAANRQKRKDYQDTKSFWRKTYLLNTLKILSIILKDKFEVNGLEELLYKELKRKSDIEFWDYIGENDEGYIL